MYNHSGLAENIEPDGGSGSSAIFKLVNDFLDPIGV